MEILFIYKEFIWDTTPSSSVPVEKKLHNARRNKRDKLLIYKEFFKKLFLN